MDVKTIICLWVILLVSIPLFQGSVSGQQSVWWDENWSYRQEILLPVDTSLSLAKNQPVDMTIVFEQACFAKNSAEHSVRVIMQIQKQSYELESQIYDLVYADDIHISSCSLVFLIPLEATGKESFFVYYDENQMPGPGYPDRVGIQDSYYSSEPITGYVFESNYYKILQDDAVVYAVSQEGQFMGYRASQYVIKLLNNTKEMLPKNGDVIGAFDFRYYYGLDLHEYSSTSDRLVQKEILVDGNLMVSCSVISMSIPGDLKTSAVYTYYYCPTQRTRIHAHIKHEVLADCIVHPEAQTDGIYATLQCGGVKSNSIRDLNFGSILPFLRLINDQDKILEFSLDADPEYIPDEPDIRVLNIEDDIDLGSAAWASFDEGSRGVVHALILGSNKVVTNAVGEQDGVQVNAYEMDYPHLPGLETNSATLEFGRNSFHEGSRDLDIPKGFCAEFDLEFFSSPTDGYSVLAEESILFQTLAALKPSLHKNEPLVEDRSETYTLNVFVHRGFSFPLGAPLAAFLGWNLSYITVELYQEDLLHCTGTASRIPFQQNIEKIRIDLRNSSIRKKVVFHNLQPGRYNVLVYREHAGLRKERSYIGFSSVEITKDATITVPCTAEATMKMYVVDQHHQGVPGAQVRMYKDSCLVASGLSDAEGVCVLSAPVDRRHRYQVTVEYTGVTVFDQQIRLSAIRCFVPLKQTIDVSLNDCSIQVVDIWDLPLGVDVSPVLQPAALPVSSEIQATHSDEQKYTFSKILSGKYRIILQYKSFIFEQIVSFPSDDQVTLVFPAEYLVHIHLFDSRGLPLTAGRILFSREGKTVEQHQTNSECSLALPPGVYLIQTYVDDSLVNQRSISVFSERTYDLVITQDPIFSLGILFVSLLLGLLGLLLSLYKKTYVFFVFLGACAFLFAGFAVPWWVLSGSENLVHTTTKMFILPVNLVTITQSSDIVSGELAYLPDLFTQVITILIVVVLLSCGMIITSMILSQKHKKTGFVLLILAEIGIVLSLVLFFVAMSRLAEVGIGGFHGTGSIDVGIPGEDSIVSMICSWGPAEGFYLYLGAILLLGYGLFRWLQELRKKE